MLVLSSDTASILCTNRARCSCSNTRSSTPALNQRSWLGDLHLHDLRHTVGMRLREAGVSEITVSDVLWHSPRSMTHHHSVAQIVELHSALD